MLELLTQRERQIARLVAEGLSNKEIARQLNVSDGTVKVHLYNIFQKLEITNRTVLATIALLQRPSGLAALSLAFLALAIADELKASEANDIFPDENGGTDEHAGYEYAAYEPWKKGILPAPHRLGIRRDAHASPERLVRQGRPNHEPGGGDGRAAHGRAIRRRETVDTPRSCWIERARSSCAFTARSNRHPDR